MLQGANVAARSDNARAFIDKFFGQNTSLYLWDIRQTPPQIAGDGLGNTHGSFFNTK
jgi:hypothetical protein